jgi:hypothetical protein
LTHSDADHASGLRELLRAIPVKNLWLHIPWLLVGDARHLFKDRRWTKDGLCAAIKKEYGIIIEIVDLAQANGCSIYYPFQRNIMGPFGVMSPSRDAYVHLLTQFEQMPEPARTCLKRHPVAGEGAWRGRWIAQETGCESANLDRRKMGLRASQRWRGNEREQ